MILVTAKYASILVVTRFPFQKQVQEYLTNMTVRAFCGLSLNVALRDLFVLEF